MTDAHAAADEFRSFREFYPHYLRLHADPRSRRLHFVGTLLFLGQWIAAPILDNGWLVLTGPLTGYAFAWVGHLVLEGNRPPTFRHPVYSLLGDLTMARDILAGRIRW
jgi:hypothetical protein